MMKMFNRTGKSEEDLLLYSPIVREKINLLNAKRAVYVLFSGIIIELFLIGVFDIPNIIANGFTGNYGLHYLLLHIMLLLVSIVGTLSSWLYIKDKGQEVFKYIKYETLIFIIVILFISSIAIINGLDQKQSDNHTLFVFFMLVIALFVLIPPRKMIFVVVIAFDAFVIAQFVYQKDATVLFNNVINGTIAVFISYFMSYFSYNSYIGYVITTIKLEETTKKLEVLVVTDQLTKIYNRRKFDENISLEINRSKRSKIPFALLMFDIDHFKKVNDTFGHHAGDAVLVGLSEFITEQIRVEDTFARYGGEEFVLILTNTNLEKAFEKAKFICQNIATQNFYPEVTITLSIGLTMFKDKDDCDKIVKRVDKALYEAKEQGRNQVISK